MTSANHLSKIEDYQNDLLFSKTVLSNINAFLLKKELSIKTSGSTGQPKTINITHSQVISSIEQSKTVLKLSKDQTALLCINPEFIGGLMMILRAIHIGMDLIVTPPSANPLANLTVPVQFAAMVPLQLERIIQHESKDQLDRLNHMETVIIGGAPIQETLSHHIKSLHCAAFSTYGMTETVSHIALKRLNGDKPSDSFKVLDSVKVGVDKDSCLWINGEITGNKTVQTNDVVTLISPREFHWIGRRDNVINSGGVKIIPEHLEHKLSPLLASYKIKYFISSMPDQSLGQKVLLLLEGAPLSDTQKRLLYDQMHSKLNKYEIPKEIICIPSFSSTASDKLDRKKTISDYIKNLP